MRLREAKGFDGALGWESHGGDGSFQPVTLLPGMTDSDELEIRASLEPLATSPPHNPQDYDVSAAPVFDELSLGVARAPLTVEAVKNADRTALFVFDQVDPPPAMFFATRRIEGQRRSFAVLAIGSERATHREVIAAYHLDPADDAKLDALASDPLRAFAYLVSRFGAQYDFEDGERGLFAPRVRYDAARFAVAGSATNEELWSALGLPVDDGPGWTLVAASHFLPSGDLLLALPFVLRSDDYVAASHA